ncbi:hypothetical protein CEUSTIGMA_g1964.t1 [Chlamydomonas eustigma]|uniref:Amino acid transporter transmembrane domain-containing protein n=1 Tax=Chlamydomonas eustigma TaxID=1157962 RepID=A0A250WUP1_9CHLO|nr:hypothetical protein CEUSTIGMA_g1964.t1 [Chlamydomonas eustigma]|eukprot:GAX74515.1 hypothetical protein CEUSTIGMA_g1964.t1 [Chlamydomonas eustigma]
MEEKLVKRIKSNHIPGDVKSVISHQNGSEEGSSAPRIQSGTFLSNKSITIRGMEIRPGDGGDGNNFLVPDKSALSTHLQTVPSAKSLKRLSATVLDLSHHGQLPGQSSWISGVFHLVTVMIGAGVLALPSCMALLGWVIGPALLVFLGAVSVWGCMMMAEVFETPGGVKSYTYREAVLHIMGGYHPYILTIFQFANLFMSAVGYTLAGMNSIEFIAASACVMDHVSSPCPMTTNLQAILVFSGLQLILNMFPNLESVWWVSMIGTFMSYLYSMLAVILSGQSLGNNGAAETTLFGKTAGSPWLRAVGMFSALGNLAFAWSSALMVPSIQATLLEPPKSAFSMRKTIYVAFGTTCVFYVAIALLGYAALGSDVPGDVLTGFSGVSTQVEVMANAAVLGHMIAAVQVYMHPIFEAVEGTLERFPRFALLVQEGWKAQVFRFLYRGLFTVVITGIGYGLPHFSLISGLNGAITYWPLQILYPFCMYLALYPQSPFVTKMMYAIAAFVLVISILAIMGSLHALITA